MHNEAENVLPIHRRIRDALSQITRTAEILYIDDGSTDETFSQLEAIRDSDQRIRILHLPANFGLTQAIRTGLQAAQGDTIITMDADGQNDPNDIPALLDKIEQGFDLVCGWRKTRHDRFFAKRLPSLLGNRFARLWLVMPVHDTGCTLKAMRAGLAKPLPLVRGFHRFIPSLATIFDAKTTEIVVQHHPRTAGKSKYNWSRTVDVLADMIVLSFLIAALRPRRPVWSWRTTECVVGLAIVAAVVSHWSFGTPFPNDAMMSYLIIFGGSALTIRQLRGRFLNPDPDSLHSPPSRIGRLVRRATHIAGLISLATMILGLVALPILFLTNQLRSSHNTPLNDVYSGTVIASWVFGAWLIAELAATMTRSPSCKYHETAPTSPPNSSP